MKNRLLLFLLFITLTVTDMSAQQTKDNCPCCSENYQSFNFWVGNWDVYDKNDNKVGSNTITKLYNGCVLREEWVATGPSRGTSYNFFDKSDNSWNQIWVDNSGFVLNLKGNLVGRAMVLKSAIQEGKKGKYFHQISWIPNEDDTVTQLWETFDEQNNKTGELFHGIYKKKLN
jgi:hypothetical protein